jgi:hypothetical protein
VAEFMVRVLHSMSAVDIRDVAAVKHGHAGDGISVVAEFMADAARVKTRNAAIR